MVDNGNGIADDYLSGKRKYDGEDKSRKRKNFNVLQFVEDSAFEVEESDSSDDDVFTDDDDEDSACGTKPKQDEGTAAASEKKETGSGGWGKGVDKEAEGGSGSGSESGWGSKKDEGGGNQDGGGGGGSQGVAAVLSVVSRGICRGNARKVVVGMLVLRVVRVGICLGNAPKVVGKVALNVVSRAICLENALRVVVVEIAISVVKAGICLGSAPRVVEVKVVETAINVGRVGEKPSDSEASFVEKLRRGAQELTGLIEEAATRCSGRISLEDQLRGALVELQSCKERISVVEAERDNYHNLLEQEREKISSVQKILG